MAAKKKAATKDLAVVDNGPTDLAAFAGYGDFGNEGFDNTGKEDFAIPFINLVQQLSPQKDKDEASFLEGCVEGDIFNSVTGDLYKEGLTFQPCITEHVFVEWVTRKNGGGFVAIHQMDSEVVAKAKAESTSFGKYKIGTDPDPIRNNDLIETYYMYGNIVDGDDFVSQAMVTFTSTKIKVYKSIMTKLRSFQVRVSPEKKVCPPLFAHRLKITSIKQTKGGDKFYNYDIKPANGTLVDSLIAPGQPLLDAGQDFYKLVKDGQAKVDHSQGQATDAKKDGTEEAPF